MVVPFPSQADVPVGAGSAVEIGSRLGWEFILEPPLHKSHPLKVVIDDATGSVLEFRSFGADYFRTLTDFETDVVIDESVFVYDGPVATDELERRERRERVAELGRELSWPTPRYWPTGMDINLDEADPDTGAFAGMLEPSGAIFARWPEGNAEPPNLFRYRPNFHVHRWTADGFHWALAVESPFSDEEVERIIASIPDRL